MKRIATLRARIRFFRFLIVLVGILAGQFLIYGPSLIGKKVLLPLDILDSPSFFIPEGTRTPREPMLIDLITEFEPDRMFVRNELLAGRFPQWDPYEFAGCRLRPTALSPFLLIGSLTASPVIVAWIQLFSATMAGLGLHLFLRRSVKVHFWAAALMAWCYPLTGFFVLLLGFPIPYPVVWLPWLLLAVDETLRHGGRRPPVLMVVSTALVIVSGQLDVAGQVLMISGIYAVWRLASDANLAPLRTRLTHGVVLLATGWLLGFALSAPFLLPFVEYAHTGIRMEKRAAGTEERPPVGLESLPQVVLPDMYGTTVTGSYRIAEDNIMSSSATTYAGLLATLLVAPLAWGSRHPRKSLWFWFSLAVFGLGWTLNIPGIVTVLRLPVLNMMSHSRLVIATTLAILVLTAIGLHALIRREFTFSRRFLIPILILGLLLGWCLFRAFHLPEPIATRLGAAVARDGHVTWLQNQQDVWSVQNWYRHTYLFYVGLCGVGLLGWSRLWRRTCWPRPAIGGLGLLLVADLLWFAHDRSTQADPSLYYPRLPILEQIHQLPPGRVLGINCLPANTIQSHGLRDIRGYDGIDPGRLVELMNLAEDPRTISAPYNRLQWFLPKGYFSTSGTKLHPVLDLLNVRYLVFAGQPPPDIHPPLQFPGYWGLINSNALPRAFIPRHVETVTNATERLQLLGSTNFNPREVAYVEMPLALPEATNAQVGIVDEIPTRITLSVQTATPSLVVLADLWDVGWHAYLNGQPAPILRVNHALRGVVILEGKYTLEFRYEPASFYRGILLAEAATAILLAWLLIDIRRSRLSKT
jgi:hypothetical protein